ncbi:MAG TPA: endolytic transglycosylase MltG [Solirubrobacterales bacterium]|nr:endolytic transglycosylase MltG [Solirubrobacterales bacterium]
MAERQDWFVDEEGNLTAPGDRDGDGLKPPTDEFGRDDPASLERERRRREREARRKARRGRTAEEMVTDRAAASEPPAAEPSPAERAAPEPPPAAPPPSAVSAEPQPRPAAAPTRQPRPAAESTSQPRKPRRSVRERFRREGGDPGPPRPSRPRGAYRRRRILALALLLAGALVVWFLVALFQPPPFDPGDGSGEAIVTVPEGATASEVADLLSESDVVSNGILFEWRLKLAGKSEEILPGRYVLAHDMSYAKAIDQLTSSGGKINVTIPEGEDRTQIAATIGDLGLSGDYLAASKSVNGFDPNRYGASDPKSLEGFLFPATYELDPGASVDRLVAEQIQAFKQNIAGVNLSYAKSKNLTVYDVLIIASMIDKEVMVPSERALVAAVIYNRLHRGMPLGIDATTRYQFHNYTGEITEPQLQSPSAYNTRVHSGLTPTPIGNPGLDAIKAAAHPAKINYLYYVLKAGGGGQHCFAATDAEFNQLVAAYRQGTAPANCRS